MAARIYKATCSANSAVKLFTNDTGKDVVATLNAVSQKSTVNPKINVALDSDATISLNNQTTSHTTVVNSGSPVSLGLAKKTGDYWGVNTSSGTKGLISQVDGTAVTTGYSSGQISGSMQFCEPYYFLKPRDYDATCTDPCPFGFMNTPTGNNINYFEDARETIGANANGSFMAGVTGGDHTEGLSYYQYGVAYDVYTNTFAAINANSYMSCGYAYDSAIASSNATSNSIAYNLYSSSFGGYYDAVAASDLYPWSPSISVDGGMYHLCGGNQNYNMLFKLYNRTDATNVFNNYPAWSSRSSYWSPSDNFQSTNKYFRYNLDDSETFRWIKWNPNTSKYYIYIDKTATDGGIYSFDDFLPTTSVAGSNTSIETIAAWTKETSDIPSGKMTRPSRIGNALWISYDENATAYFTEDLLTYKTLAQFSSSSVNITNASVLNQDADGNTFFGNSDNNKVQQLDTGYASVDKGGFLENNTEIGAFERSGIIIPKGESLYIENISEDADVSVNLMTVDI